MPRFIKLSCIAALVLCAVSLVISVYPGALQQLLFVLVLLGIVGVPLWLIGFVILLFARRRKGLNQGDFFPKRYVPVTVVVLVLTYAVLKYYVPRRIVFAMHRPSFAAHVAAAPESEWSGEPLDEQIGIYHVDEYAKDPRGGVYFRTGTTTNMINIVSWGYVYKPNDEGSPFGNAYYRVHPLGDGWYWFVADDDW